MNYICIMNNTAFTYDDVSVAPDRQIGMNSHPQWELSYVISGRGIRIIGDKEDSFVEGEIILIPPHIPHLWQFDPSHTDADGNIANISIFFESETLDGLEKVFPELSGVVRRIKSQKDAISYVGESNKKILSLLIAMRGVTHVARLSMFLDLVQALADDDDCVSVGCNNTLSRVEQRLEAIRIYCRCNYARNITLDEMAAHTGMNKSAFCTFMRRHAGMSLSEFINNVRLGKAMEMLLHTDQRISSIAYDVGFSNVTYFNRLFRNRFGRTPKSVRTE